MYYQHVHPGQQSFGTGDAGGKKRIEWDEGKDARGARRISSSSSSSSSSSAKGKRDHINSQQHQEQHERSLDNAARSVEMSISRGTAAKVVMRASSAPSGGKGRARSRGASRNTKTRSRAEDSPLATAIENPGRAPLGGVSADTKLADTPAARIRLRESKPESGGGSGGSNGNGGAAKSRAKSRGAAASAAGLRRLAASLEATINRSMSKFQHRLDQYELNLADMWNQRANISIHRVDGRGGAGGGGSVGAGSGGGNRGHEMSAEARAALFQHVLTEIRGEVRRASDSQMKELRQLRELITAVKAAAIAAASSTAAQQNAHSDEDSSIRQVLHSELDIERQQREEAIQKQDNQAQERHSVILNQLQAAAMAIAQFTDDQGTMVRSIDEKAALLLESSVPTLGQEIGGKLEMVEKAVSGISDRLRQKLDAGVSAMEAKIGVRMRDLQEQLAAGFAAELAAQHEAASSAARQFENRMEGVRDLIATSEKNILRKLNFNESVRVLRQEVEAFNIAAVDLLATRLEVLSEPVLLDTRMLGLDPSRLQAAARSDSVSHSPTNGKGSRAASPDRVPRLGGGFGRLSHGTQIDFSTAVTLIRFQGVGTLDPDEHDVTGIAVSRGSSPTAGSRHDQVSNEAAAETTPRNTDATNTALAALVARELGFPQNTVTLLRRSKSESQVHITAGALVDVQLDAYLLYAYADAAGNRTKHEFMNDEDTWYRCFVRTVNDLGGTAAQAVAVGTLAGPVRGQSSTPSEAARLYAKSTAAPVESSGTQRVPTVDLLCREFSPGKTVSAPRRFKAVPQRFLRPVDGAPCALNLDFEIWHNARMRQQFSHKHAVPLWDSAREGEAVVDPRSDSQGIPPTARTRSGSTEAKAFQDVHPSHLNRGRQHFRNSSAELSGAPPLPQPHSLAHAGVQAADVRGVLASGLRQMNLLMARQMERIVDALAVHEANREKQLRQQQRQQEELIVAQRRSVEFGDLPHQNHQEDSGTSTSATARSTQFGSKNPYGIVGRGLQHIDGTSPLSSNSVADRLDRIEQALSTLLQQGHSSSNVGSVSAPGMAGSVSDNADNSKQEAIDEPSDEELAVLEENLQKHLKTLTQAYERTVAAHRLRQQRKQGAQQNTSELQSASDRAPESSGSPESHFVSLDNLRESVDGLALNAHIFFVEMKRARGEEPAREGVAASGSTSEHVQHVDNVREGETSTQ